MKRLDSRYFKTQVTFLLVMSLLLSVLSFFAVGGEPLANQPPIAEIVSIDPNPVSIGEQVNFTGRGYDPENATKYFYWDFNGDGTWEISNYPVSGNGWQYHYVNYTYTSQGTYNVILTVMDVVGLTDTDNDTVEVLGVVADFTYEPADPTIEDTIQFTDTSIDYNGTIVSWYWEFGDGTTSTQQNPTHRYTYPGTYPVTLTVTNNNGLTDYITKNVYVIDLTKPEWRNQKQSKNFLESGESVILSAEGRDSVGLSYAWLSTNESGVWENFSGYQTGWNYRRAVVVNHAQVSGNLVNFPVLVKTTMNTNFVQSDADDIFFTSFDGEKLNHEIEYYNGTTGELITWVNVPSLSSTTDTTLYLYYGNQYCQNQQNVAGTWNSNYNWVLHFKEGGAGTRYDSTNNDRDMTPYSYDGNEKTTGNIDGADFLMSSESDSLRRDDGTKMISDTQGTLEIYFKTTNDITSEQSLVSQCMHVVGGGLETGGGLSFFMQGGKLGLWTPGQTTWQTTSTVFSANTWYYIVIKREITQADQVFIDGASKPINITLGDGNFWFGNMTQTSQHLRIGNMFYGTNYEPDGHINVDGTFDELRHSNVARSEEWIETTYNTINSPSTFITVGPEEFAGEIQYGSPMQMQNNNLWQLSDFTWQNTSYGHGTVIGWRIYYRDTSGNVNGTNILSFAIDSAPEKPGKPSGQANGNINTEYTYTASTTDSDGDQLYYWFEWGDNTNSGWVGPYASGATASAKHKWTTKGTYAIKVKAKDVFGAESVLSDPLSVTMPRNKAINTLLLQFLQNHPQLSRLLQLLSHRLGLQ